ncbi:DUF2829 domain-containing protein [uncultured Ruegeria sp.]|uniref:DUF2829 domain-containing protein n=1 Tax=uncultured Ruegeria sp. TaxID=259304 RepID=UPI0026262B24|nr:DUF2829 domain-containing protein [uncultured Ruegeria sp.]
MDQTYYGTKKVKATPMTRGRYNDYRGWDLPDDERATEEGYLVEYLDGGKGNHPDHTGYITWSPKTAFDPAYTPIDCMNFGHALQAIKEGKRLARKGWNGKDMFVFLVSGSHFKVNREPLLSILGEGTGVDYRPHIDLKQPDGSIGVWQPSMGDVMADDWYIVEGGA